MVVDSPGLPNAGKAVAIARTIPPPIRRLMPPLAVGRAVTACPSEFKSLGASSGCDIIPAHQSQQWYTPPIAQEVSNHRQVKLLIPVQVAQLLCGWWLNAARGVGTILVSQNLTELMTLARTAKTNLFGKNRESLATFNDDSANIFALAFPLVPGDSVGDAQQVKTPNRLLHDGLVGVGSLDVLVGGGVDYATVSIKEPLEPPTGKILLHTYSLPCQYPVGQGAS